MSDLSSNNDFESEPVSQPSKSNNVVWIVLGCLGCGGLGVVILGFLAAIALPSFLNQANRAKASEAKTSVGAMNRAQQAHFLENQAFASSIEELQLGLPSQTANYTYAMAVQPDNASVIITATPVEEPLKRYTGAVFAIEESPGLTTTVTEICESSELGDALPTLNLETGTVDCPPGSTSIDAY